MPKPLFIIGNPRSGTSLFRIMLSCHSKIVIPPECGFIQWLHDKYCNWDTGNNNLVSIDSFVKDLSECKKIETWGLDYLLLKDELLICNPSSYAELCLAVISNYSKSKGKDPFFLGDKNNYYIDHLSLLSKLYPDALFLAITRDVRDVVCSYKEVNLLRDTKYKPVFSDDVKTIAVEWTNNNKMILSCGRDLKNWYFVKYEDLVIDPESELVGVCDFIGLDFELEMLNFFKNNDEPDEMLDWKRKIQMPLDKSKIGRYKKDLLELEKREILNISREVLQKLNYEL